jgi:hypothetical protein
VWRVDMLFTTIELAFAFLLGEASVLDQED